MSTGKIIGLGLSAVIVFLMVYMMIQDTSSSNRTVVKQDVQEVKPKQVTVIISEEEQKLEELKKSQANKIDKFKPKKIRDIEKYYQKKKQEKFMKNLLNYLHVQN